MAINVMYMYVLSFNVKFKQNLILGLLLICAETPQLSGTYIIVLFCSLQT